MYQALASAASGKRLRLIEEDEEAPPEKAAEFLQVSRPYLAKLLDGGEIPFHSEALAGAMNQWNC